MLSFFYCMFSIDYVHVLYIIKTEIVVVCDIERVTLMSLVRLLEVHRNHTHTLKYNKI